MSDENNKRGVKPVSRDELDIDSLIRNLRTEEPVKPDPQPEQVPERPRPAVQKSAAQEPPVQEPGRSVPETPPARRKEEEEPGVREMQAQIQALMAGWNTSEQEKAAPVNPVRLHEAPAVSREEAPELGPPAEEKLDLPWDLASIRFPIQAKTELPVIPEQAAEQEAPEETPEKSRRGSGSLLYLPSLSYQKGARSKRPEPEETVPVFQQEPEPVHNAAPEELVLEPTVRVPVIEEQMIEPRQPEEPEQPTAEQRQREAFESGQVVTLRLRRHEPEKAVPAAPAAAFEPEAESGPDLITDVMPLIRPREKPVREAEVPETAPVPAEEPPAQQIEEPPVPAQAPERPAETEPPAAAAEPAEPERGEPPVTEEPPQKAEPQTDTVPVKEPEEPVKEAQPFQVITLRVRRREPGQEKAEPRRAFDQEEEDSLEAMLEENARQGHQRREAQAQKLRQSMMEDVQEPPAAEEPDELPAQEEPAEPEALPEEPVEENGPEEAPPEQAEQPDSTEAAPEEPETPQPEAEPPATEEPEEPVPQMSEEDEGEEEDNWDGDIADESLLERPDRSPGLLRQLGAFLFCPRPKRTEKAEGNDEPSDAAFEPVQKKPSLFQKKKKPEPAKAPEKVIELPQEKPGLLKKKLAEVEDKANDFADAMFQGDSEEAAEEEAAHRVAERYIPGTDEAKQPRRKPKPARERPPVRRAPDTSPKELSRIFYNSWKSGRGRLPFQLVMAILLLVITALAGNELPLVQVPVLSENLQLTGTLLTFGLGIACALGLDTLLEGIFQLFRGRPGLNTLASMGVILTVVDGVWYALLSREGPLPFCGFAALSLWSVAWGNGKKKQGLYLSCQMAAAVSHPQRLTLDQGKWDKGTFIKETGTVKGFGSQIQEMDGAQRIYRYAAPVMMIASILFGILSVVGQKSPQHLIWSWSVIFVLATPLTSTLAYGLPYARLVKRLNRSGVILAGWDGVDSMRGEAGIVITDNDLFPEGFVQFNGIKNFGQVSLEKLTGCTASMVREAGLGLAKIFDDQIRTQGGFYRRVDELKYSEAGGYSGLIRGDQVLIGSAAYMKVMGVPLRQGYQVKNAVFCVINGQLQGIFALNYSQPFYVKPALNALIHGGVNPILATRDFNITPQMLRQRFRLPTERMEYPPVDRRHELSAKGQPHNDVLAALIYREGLGAYTDAILGGRRFRKVVRINTILAVAASAVGALLGFYLTMMSAYYSLSPLNILFFLVMWLVPNLLVSGGVDKF